MSGWTWFTLAPGPTVLADRHYARHDGLVSVWTQGAELVVYRELSSSAVRALEGSRAILNGVPQRSGTPDWLDPPVERGGCGILLGRTMPASAAFLVAPDPARPAQPRGSLLGVHRLEA